MVDLNYARTDDGELEDNKLAGIQIGAMEDFNHASIQYVLEEDFNHASIHYVLEEDFNYAGQRMGGEIIMLLFGITQLQTAFL